MTRQEAYIELMSRPRFRDIPEGGFRKLPRHPLGPCGPSCQRRASSDPDIIKRNLGRAYVEHRRQDHGPDASTVGPVRRGLPRRLRLVR